MRPTVAVTSRDGAALRHLGRMEIRAGPAFTPVCKQFAQSALWVSALDPFDIFLTRLL